MQNDADYITSFLSSSRKLIYKNPLVSVKEFICSERFMGKLTRGGEEIYPRWIKELTFIMNEPTKYVPVLTGAIGTGKSRAAILGTCYATYRLLELRDPWGYHHKDAAGKMAIVFFNLNKTLSESKGFNIYQNYLCNSPWFCERGRIAGTVEKRIYFDLFEYVLASPIAQAELGQDVILAIMDEVDSPKSTIKTKEKVIKSVTSTLRRLENRFVDRGQTLGKFWIVASKQEQAAFIDAYVLEKKDDPEVYIVDMPVWEAEEKAEYGDKTFAVKLGDIYTPSKMLEDAEEIRLALADGFKIINVPDIPKFRKAFAEDVIGSLRDYAGISASGQRKNKLFKTEQYLLQCYDKKKEDPVSQIDVPLGIKDERELMFYLDSKKIRVPRNVPRFIHGDIAYAHGANAYGLAMSCVSGWSSISRENDNGEIIIEKLPVVETDFVMRILAPEGDEIPLGRIRKFIIDLKKMCGFNIVQASFDLQTMSKDTTQILEKAGVECDWISVDKKPEIYRSFRDVCKEERWCCHAHACLHLELSNLEDDPNTNKIDHPQQMIATVVSEDGVISQEVVTGSKDCADAVAASAMNAIEKCAMPPDIEIMKRALGAAIQKDPLRDLWWVDSSGLPRPKTEEKKIEKPKSGFANLFKKSQLGGGSI